MVALAASIAIFDVSRAVLLAPIPAVDADEVLGLARHSPGNPRSPMPVQTFFDWRDRNETLASLGAYSEDLDFNLEGSPPERVTVVAVSGGFFSTLGIRSHLGESFGALADEPGAPALAVISHRLWTRRFNGSEDVLDSTLLLSGFPWQIVAVMPDDFAYPHRGVDVWLPMGTLYEGLQWENRSMASLYAVGRLKADTSEEQVRLDLERVTESIADDTGVPQESRPLVQSLAREILGSTADSLRVLAAAVFFVLLIACANVANLLLARGFGRGGEVAVRMAFGARRREIIRLMLVESVTLAVASCAVALFFAAPTARHIVTTWIPNSGVDPARLGLTPGVAAFALGLALLSGLSIGLAPALRHSRQNPNAAMRHGGRTVAAGNRLQSAMVVAETAVAVALLVAAGLMLRSIDKLLKIDPGFETDSVLVQKLAPNPDRYDGLTSWLNLNQQILDEGAALSTVDKIAVTLDPPLQPTPPRLVRAAKPGMALRPDVLPLTANPTVSEDYFDVMGMKVLSGRGFDATDDLGHPLVAIVDEALAESFWPDEDPVGQRIAVEYDFPDTGYREGVQVEPNWRTVVGVVNNTRLESLRGEPRLTVYLPLRQPPSDLLESIPNFALLSKTRGRPLDSAPALQSVAAQIDPELPVYDATTLRGLVDNQLVQERLLSSLLGAFGVLALLLAAAGVYAALAHLVAHRTREMGVRLALGAEPGRLRRQVAWWGLRLTLWGTAIGLAVSPFLTRFLESRLYGIGRLDPLAFLGMPLLLLLVAGLACLIPAWRASRVDPSVSLRYE